MGAPNPLPFNARFSDSDWSELAANRHPGGGSAFSSRSADASIVGQVTFDKIKGFARYALGWNYVDTEAGRLLRTPPIAHPYYTNLYCTAFNEVPFALGAETSLDSGPIPLPQDTLFIDPDDNSEGNPTLPGYASYRRSQVALKFAPLPYDLRSDEEMAENGYGEENRWTELDVVPRTEILSIDGQQLTFCEGNTPPFGNKVPGSIGQILIKSDMRFTWYRVPYKFIFSLYQPTKILNALGSVNTDTFLGIYSPGTLLLSGVQMVKNIWPFAAQTGAVIEDRFEYDVTFHFTWFDPPRGPDANLTLPGGHNLQPFRAPNLNAFTLEFANATAASGFWYTCTFNGNVPFVGNSPGSPGDGQTLLRRTQFSDLFTYVGS